MAIRITADRSSSLPGDSVLYRILFLNDSPNPATHVVISCAIPHQAAVDYKPGSVSEGATTVPPNGTQGMELTLKMRDDILPADRMVSVTATAVGDNGLSEQDSVVVDVSVPVVVVPPPPVPTPNPLLVSGVVLAPSRPSPQQVGTLVLWTATPSGGVTPYSYQWWVFYNSAWSKLTDWTDVNTLAWTPMKSSAYYQIAVAVRSAGNNTENYEGSQASPFPIVEAGQVPSPIPAPASVSRLDPISKMLDQMLIALKRRGIGG